MLIAQLVVKLNDKNLSFFSLSQTEITHCFSLLLFFNLVVHFINNYIVVVGFKNNNNILIAVYFFLLFVVVAVVVLLYKFKYLRKENNEKEEDFDLASMYPRKMLTDLDLSLEQCELVPNANILIMPHHHNHL